MAFLGGASSSSTPSWIYDAFLSFYGEDTRKGFTDHLYAALKRKGVITFRDDEKLERGKDICQELLKAIQKSQYAIVVISKRYAFSKWCLTELTKILECRTKIGMIVLPVFYHVDPSSVRNQIGSFTEAFITHSQNTEVDEEQWKMWKKALKDVGSLAGWHIHDRHEAIVVEDISRQILDGVNHTSTTIFDRLVGIAPRASELLSLLSLGSNDVHFIGICGMGGIGKTTLAKIIYNRVSSEFEARCFVANIREMTQKNSIEYLQTQLVCEVLHESNLKIWNTHVGVELIARSICNRNVFIVLDDVDDEDQLKVLAGSHDWFGQGSRVIVTSRDRHLLKRHVDIIYEMAELSKDESLELFCWKAFKKDHLEKDYEKLSQDIVHYAQGLPLAIEVFGSHLCGRKMEAWEAALEQLKSSLKKVILDKLRISYEGLEDFEKKLFLDIACVFNGKCDNKLKCLNDYFAIDIEVLKDRCLIKDLYGVLIMHDLLKKMGQQIVYLESPSDPGKRSRLWCYEDIMNVLNCDTGTNTIEGINLDLSLEKVEKLNIEGFSKMKRLKKLVIHNDQSNNGFPALKWYGELSNFNLSNELHYLEWVGYPFENLPINFQANKLLVLKMPYNCIKQFNGWKNFDKVKFIDMSYSYDLTEIPDLSEMPSLVELDLQYCRSLSIVHSSPGNLKRLKKWEMEGCYCLNKLPDEINFESLEYLNLAGCLRLEKFPNVSGNMKSLRFLDLIGTAIKGLPHSFKGLSSLEYFNLCGSMNYRVRLSGHEGPQHKPDQFLEYNPSRPPRCTKLMREINACGNGSNPISFFHFHNDFSSLSSLKTLDMSYRNLTDAIIPYELCYLSSLEYLDLSGNKLTTIPSSICLLPKLRFLYFRSCTNLKTLSKLSFSRLSCLELLHLGYCNMVDGVIPDDLCCFSSLKSLDLCNNKFRKLPYLIQLSQLRRLWLEDCTELEALPKLPLSLGSLWIKGCVSLKIPWVEMEGGFNSGYAIGVVRFDYDGRPYQIFQLPSYHQISLSSNRILAGKYVCVVAPALLYEIPKWFNRRITSYFEIVESCFQVKHTQESWWELWGGFVLLILYRVEPDTFQEKRKKQKVYECGKSNYGIFDGIDPALPHFLCHFQFNKAGTKNSFLLCAPEAPSIGLNAFWAFIPFRCFKGIWELVNTSISVEASIESLNLNVEIECGMRAVNEDELLVLPKVNDISPCALDFETSKDLLKWPCEIRGFKAKINR